MLIGESDRLETAPRLEGGSRHPITHPQQEAMLSRIDVMWQEPLAETGGGLPAVKRGGARRWVELSAPTDTPRWWGINE